LRIGNRVRLDGVIQTVVGLSGTVVRLAREDGEASVIQLAHLLASPGFGILDREERPRQALYAAAMRGVPEAAVEDALRWERHIVEVLTGVRPDAPERAKARPSYDPARRSLPEREEAKAAELAAAGQAVTARTVKRKRLQYEARGLAGLVDWRADRARQARGRTDGRVVEALEQAISEQERGSTRKASYYLWRTRQILADQYGPDAVVMPGRATFYRLFDRVTAGRHTTGSARTRRSLANRPEGPFGQLTAVRPGQFVEIDSTPFDIAVLLDNGVPGRAELPGWPDVLSMARPVLPHRRMLELDERLAHAAARPVIVPETIICDNGKAYISHNFRSACRVLGISLQPAHPQTPTDKPQAAYCTSSERFVRSSRRGWSGGLGRAADLGTVGRVAGVGRVVEVLAFVVIPLGADNSGATPLLDGRIGHAMGLRGLGEGEHSGDAQPLAAAA
jgi:hypothetical protein